MKRAILTLLLFSALFFTGKAYSLFGAGDIVFDPTAVAKLIEQIEQMSNLIERTQRIFNRLGKIKDLIDKWEEIDHINLAGGKFAAFLAEYRSSFDQIIDQIESYQEGGLFGQIDRLDEVYFAYHDDWESQDGADDFTSDANPLHRAIKKQILFTRIQLKHAAKVGAKIRETIPQSEEQIRTLLDDTAQAVGIMQSIKIGNELTGMVAKTMQTLNIQLNELLQAETAKGLETNNINGLQKNRAREALKGFGEPGPAENPVPLNPVGAY